ncbi:carbohydrate ABC transporter membrane protein 2, CUT1 family [Tistlia consotensis]|uniref:sn-glycerol-3-phosphate transport system permease protein UgpE n=1 Tax=Tistlia consotensis USBA 355 TaxID=560819 RepID=A0A1Y6B7M0_9PROT|nr:sn-glycerol-3-phosphate ABC transporter permease UgpE [Tistlia consotensis]SME88525.1 carbohydrate ABC transporter membrane protein 2, CUT1 family [Tistlia consotensis USBA 355]SNR24994.1 carbohydrate ABC transporter membrane protein 2, CUT1 family [Tistlia consotensis]
MVERSPRFDAFCWLLLSAGLLLVFLPLYYALVIASQPDDTARLTLATLPGSALWHNLAAAWAKDDLQRQLVNSTVMALGIALGKLSISLLSAFAVTYFRFRFRTAAFWLIFITLMLPVEVRIVPTFEVAANVLSPVTALAGWLGWRLELNVSLLDSYAGLILPLIASATATFLFRQFFLVVPDELCEAAKVDGAGPLRFFRDILLPMSRTSMAALFVILFIYGWNQYLWPLLATTRAEMTTVVIGVARTLPTDNADTRWNLTMATTLLAMLPPVLVVVLLQRWFVRGLVDQEK